MLENTIVSRIIWMAPLSFFRIRFCLNSSVALKSFEKQKFFAGVVPAKVQWKAFWTKVGNLIWVFSSSPSFHKIVILMHLFDGEQYFKKKILLWGTPTKLDHGEPNQTLIVIRNLPVPLFLNSKKELPVIVNIVTLAQKGIQIDVNNMSAAPSDQTLLWKVQISAPAHPFVPR